MWAGIVPICFFVTFLTVFCCSLIYRGFSGHNIHFPIRKNVVSVSGLVFFFGVAVPLTVAFFRSASALVVMHGGR